LPRSEIAVNWIWYLFSFEGRINRAKFWLSLPILLGWMFLFLWIMWLIMITGLLTTLAGGGLLYYVMNVVDIETKGDTLKNTLATAALDSSAGAGPILLVVGGLAILVGALVP
jgi:uncharacterized membrane protein YhaH (DUF805 family)